MVTSQEGRKMTSYYARVSAPWVTDVPPTSVSVLMPLVVFCSCHVTYHTFWQWHVLQVLSEWKESNAQGLCQPICSEHPGMPDLCSTQCNYRGASPHVAQWVAFSVSCLHWFSKLLLVHEVSLILPETVAHHCTSLCQKGDVVCEVLTVW
jgi:hypothetical protein